MVMQSHYYVNILYIQYVITINRALLPDTGALQGGGGSARPSTVTMSDHGEKVDRVPCAPDSHFGIHQM